MTYPANADMVVVQHSWWNDATRRGVDAQVTWTPLPFTGAAAPNLVDSSARGWIKLQSWTSKPEPVSGYMAVPLTASNDPDLQAFPGYRVAAGQEAPFTIAVDVAAPFVAADQRMVDALAALTPPVTLTVGAQVRAVWLTDVAVVSPSPTSPPAFLTATQTESCVLDAVAAHDTDPQAHPDIRALANSGGGGGGGGPSTYVHTQSSPSASWLITHNLGRRPQVTVVDPAGARVIPDLAYPSLNTVSVVHAAPATGSAYLS